MKKELILVLDFGGQYNQLIARRVRECNVYCEVHPYNLSIEKIREMNPKGIIFTGGPNSVYGENSPLCDKEIFNIGIPVLGICYGSQLMAYLLGGSVATAPVSEYGKTEVSVDAKSKIFEGVQDKTICWMSHTDYIEKAPEDFNIVGSTPVCPVAAMECVEKNLYAVQFHPEVMHTKEGTKMLSNFVYNICNCAGDWTMDSFVEKSIEEIRERIGNGKALCALSGGVDSSVAAVLLSKAIGKQLTCVFVDHGLLRKDEGDEVEAIFGPEGHYDLNFIRVNAQDRFYEALAGVEDPERKRKIIGEGIAFLQKEYPNLKLICLSMGGDGSKAVYRDIHVAYPAFLQEATIETTGAGDTFCACMIHTVLENGIDHLDEEKLKEMLKFANAAASLVTTKKGALRVMPTKEEVETFIENFKR